MVTPPAQPPAETAEEQEQQEQATSQPQVSAEKTAQEQQEQYLQQEIPEMQMGGVVFNALSIIGLSFAKNRFKVINAFDAVSNPNYVYRLLNVREGRIEEGILRQEKEDLAIVEKEMAKQRARARKQGKQLDSVEVGALMFKKRVGFDELYRKKQALSFAEVVHNRVNATELKLKIENAARIYGVDAAQLKKDMAGWLKNNPGRTYDDYLVVHGRELYCQQAGVDPKKSDKTADQKEKSIKKRFREKEDRIEAIKQEKEVIRRGREEIKNALDTNQTRLTDEEVKQKRQSILRGTAQPQVAPTPATTPSTTPSTKPLKTPTGKISLFNRFNNFRNKVAIDIKNRLAQLLAPLRRLIERINVIRSAIIASLKSAISAAAKKAFAFVVKLGTKVLGKLGLKALGQAIGQLVGSIAPGIGNALAATLVTIAQFLGIDEALLKGLKFVFTVFVGIIIAMIILIPLGLLGSGLINPQKAFVVPSLAPTENKTQTWYKFESQFLSLDPNRHNNMEKGK